MGRKLLLVIIGCFVTLTFAKNVLGDEEKDIDTVSVEATTLTYAAVNNEDDGTRSENPCTTARGLKGSCMTINECYRVLPEDSKETLVMPLLNLAEILVNASGFCDGNLEARSDVTPTVFDKVLKSEVMICCPEEPKIPKQIKLDEPQPESANDTSFRGRSCGYLKIDESEIELLHNETKILKGWKASLGELPWVVALMNRGRQFCGGSLINHRTVLTAAHCVQHMTASDVKNLRMQIGDLNIYSSSETKHEARGAQKVLFHKGFSMKHLQHDIALIHLNAPVTYTKNIQPVCLHPGNPPFEDGSTRAVVAGWGALSEGGSQPDDLRAVKIRVLTKAECLKRYSNSANKITDGMVCAGADKGDDSCQGDSGGPLTVDSRDQAKQIGVVSWGVGCGRYPGVYTSVYKYRSWIEKNQA